MLRLKRHTDIDSFLDRALIHLEKEEALNNLMLGLSLRIQQDPAYYQDILLATVSEDDCLVLATMMTVPEKLLIYAVSGGKEAAVKFMIDYLKTQNILIPGVVGPRALAETFSTIWSTELGCNMDLDMHMRVYELREVNHAVIGAGVLRPAQAADLDFIIDGIVQFQQDAGLDSAPDLDTCAESARRRLANRSAYIWEHTGRAVSLAAISRPTKNGITVNLVYTPKELRNHGYATSCVAALSQYLLDSGYKFCTLFTDLSNPTSNSIYQKIGYRPIGDFDGYYFRY